MTLNQGLIFTKLGLIDKYQRQLAEILKSSDSEIFNSPEKMAAIERFFQLLVDTMVDVNRHVVGELDPERSVDLDLQGTFYPLGEKKVLPEDFARKLAPVVSVRNRLVHQYEEIDKKLFLKNLRENFSQFEMYNEYIKKFLSK